MEIHLGQLAFTFVAHSLLFKQGNLLGVATTTAQAAHKSKSTKQQGSNDTHNDGGVLAALQLRAGGRVGATSIQTGKNLVKIVAPTVETAVGVTLDGILERVADLAGVTIVHSIVPVIVVCVTVVVVLVVGLVGVVLLLLHGLFHFVVRLGLLAHDALLGLNDRLLEVGEGAAVVLGRKLGILSGVGAVFIVKGTEEDVLAVGAVRSNVVLHAVALFLLLLPVVVVVAVPLAILVAIVLLVLVLLTVNLFDLCCAKQKKKT